jgi:hypothetical protein
MAGAALLAPTVLAQPVQAAVHRFHEPHVLGASLDMVVVGADAATAARALAAARTEIARLDKVLSGWRPDSELARLNGSTGPLAVSPDLYHVIAACEAWREVCDGAFSARLVRPRPPGARLNARANGPKLQPWPRRPKPPTAPRSGSTRGIAPSIGPG